MRTSRAAALALGAALLLSACDGGDEPSDPMSTWTPTGTFEVPSSTAATGDPLTEAPQGETAREFIRRWVALGNRMQETGDTDAFLAVVGPDCDSCHNYADRVAKIYENHGYLKGGTERILSFKAESKTQWIVTMEADPTEYTESRGGEPKTLPGGKYRSRLYLAHFKGRWIVGATEGLPL